MQISGDIKRVDVTAAVALGVLVVGRGSPSGAGVAAPRLQPSPRFERLTGVPGRDRLVRPVLHRARRLLHAALVPAVGSGTSPRSPSTAWPCCPRGADLLDGAAAEGPGSLRAVQAISCSPAGRVPVPRAPSSSTRTSLHPGGQPRRRQLDQRQPPRRRRRSPPGTPACSVLHRPARGQPRRRGATAASSPTPWRGPAALPAGRGRDPHRQPRRRRRRRRPAARAGRRIGHGIGAAMELVHAEPFRTPARHPGAAPACGARRLRLRSSRLRPLHAADPLSQPPLASSTDCLPAEIHGIIARSSAPTCSIWCSRALLEQAGEVRPGRCGSRRSTPRRTAPDWISSRILLHLGLGRRR